MLRQGGCCCCAAARLQAGHAALVELGVDDGEQAAQHRVVLRHAHHLLPAHLTHLHSSKQLHEYAWDDNSFCMHEEAELAEHAGQHAPRPRVFALQITANAALAR